MPDTRRAFENADWQTIIDIHEPESQEPIEWLRYGTALLNTIKTRGEKARNQQQQAAIAYERAKSEGAPREVINTIIRAIVTHNIKTAAAKAGLYQYMRERSSEARHNDSDWRNKDQRKDALAGPSRSTVAEVIKRTSGRDRRSMSILVLGCGSGEELIELLDSGFHVAAMDANTDTVHECRNRLATRGEWRVQLAHGDPTRIPWPARTFDIVIAGSLHRGYEKQMWGVASEVKRVLRMEGLFIGPIPGNLIDTWGSGDELERIRQFWGLPHWGTFGVEAVLATHGEETTTVIAKMLDFTSSHSGAFKEIDIAKQPISDHESLSELRLRVISAITSLGYKNVEPGTPLVLCPRHKWEDRQLPLLLYKRHAGSMPLVQYDVQGGIISLWLFGPIQPDRRCPFAKLEINGSSWLEPLDKELARKGLHAVQHDVAVGVHSTELLLRSTDLRHHRSRSLPIDIAEYLTATIAQTSRRCALLNRLFTALRPFLLYNGHDCYDEAIDINMALALDMPSLLQPKGKRFLYYSSQDQPGRWERGGSFFVSHMNLRFKKEIELRWNSIEPAALTEANELMEKRMHSLSALPYMRSVNYREVDSDVSTGWRNFRNALGVPIYENKRHIKSRRATWIMAFHSFADEPFRWGMDSLWSLYDLFLEAARHIQQTYPSDLIVFRPHPLSLGVFTEPDLVEKVEKGMIQGPTAFFDIYLQLRLCQEIAALGMECELSALQPAAEILQPENSIVITRHGSILIEAAWMSRLGIFSQTAPYAFLFAKDLQFVDQGSLHRAIERTRQLALEGRDVLPSQEDILKYQTLLKPPHRPTTTTGTNEVLMPTAATPLSSFDGLSFGTETISEAANRIMSLLSESTEKDALRSAWGWSDL